MPYDRLFALCAFGLSMGLLALVGLVFARREAASGRDDSPEPARAAEPPSFTRGRPLSVVGKS